MYATRSSKRQTGLQDRANLPLSTSEVPSKTSTKCKIPVNDRNTGGKTRNLDRLCKKPSSKSTCKEPIMFQTESNANKEIPDLKVLKSESVHTLIQPLTSRNKVHPNSAKLNNQENFKNKVTKVSKKYNLKLAINLDKENYPAKARVTAYNKNPVESISENACQRKPVWAPKNNVPLKPAKKRSRISDVYDIDRDEDLMTDNPFKKKKASNKRPKITKSKVCFNKANLPVSNHNKITGMFISKPAAKLKVCKDIAVNITCNLQTHPIKTPDIANIASSKVLKKVTHHEQSEANQDPNLILNDFGLSPENAICSEQPFVGKDDTEITITASEAVLDKGGTLGKVKKDIEDCINECVSSFKNLDTSMAAVCSINEEYEDKLSNRTPIKQTYDVNNKTNSFLHNSDERGQFFLVPKMTSTPESGDYPVIEIANPSQNAFGKQLPEISSIPCTASRNILFDLFDSEFLSPEKSRLDAQEVMLLESPFKEEKIKVIPEDISPIKKVNSRIDSGGMEGKEIRSKRTAPKDKPESADLSYKPITEDCDMDIHEYTLFDSPTKKRRVKKRIAFPSPSKTEEPFSEIKLSTPRISYNSPHQFKRRPISKVKENENTKTKTKVDKMAEDMNRHFSDLEDTELCIE